MNKCEWKDGKLNRCKEADYVARRTSQYVYSHTGDVYVYGVANCVFTFCPFCGADIHKPEEPLIVKSGGTFVAYSEGINYLFCGQTNNPNFNTGKSGKGSSEWVDFSEITLNDEIAKLRPMVSIKDANTEEYLQKLYGVDEMGYLIFDCRGDGKGVWKCTPVLCRLATPHELRSRNETMS